MWERLLTLIVEEHRGKAIGILLGLIASILFVSYGFWKTIFIIFCLFAGYFVGKKIDENKSLESWIQKIFKD